MTIVSDILTLTAFERSTPVVLTARQGRVVVEGDPKRLGDGLLVAVLERKTDSVVTARLRCLLRPPETPGTWADGARVALEIVDPMCVIDAASGEVSRADETCLELHLTPNGSLFEVAKLEFAGEEAARGLDWPSAVGSVDLAPEGMGRVHAQREPWSYTGWFAAGEDRAETARPATPAVFLHGEEKDWDFRLSHRRVHARRVAADLTVWFEGRWVPTGADEALSFAGLAGGLRRRVAAPRESGYVAGFAGDAVLVLIRGVPASEVAAVWNATVTVDQLDQMRRWSPNRAFGTGWRWADPEHAPATPWVALYEVALVPDHRRHPRLLNVRPVAEAPRPDAFVLEGWRNFDGAAPTAAAFLEPADGQDSHPLGLRDARQGLAFRLDGTRVARTAQPPVRIGAFDLEIAGRWRGTAWVGLSARWGSPIQPAGFDLDLKCDGDASPGAEDPNDYDGALRGPSLSLPLTARGPSGLREHVPEFEIAIRDGLEAGHGHRIEIELRSYQPAPRSPPLLYIDPAPLLVAAIPPVALRGGGRDTVVARFGDGPDGYAWQTPGVEQLRLELPPQSLGEEPFRAAAPTPPPATPLRLVLGEPARITLLPFGVRAAPEVPWNLRRLLSRPDRRSPGAIVHELDAELVYGVRTELRREHNRPRTWVQLAEIATTHGAPREVPEPADNAAGSVVEWLGTERGRALQSRRPAALQLHPSGAVGRHVDLDEGVLHRVLARKNDREVWQGGEQPTYGLASMVPFGRWWKDLVARGVSSSGRLSGVTLSALGGWADLEADFPAARMWIASRTSMGRPAEVRIARTGRIGVLYNAARYVVVYRRTVAPQEADLSEGGKRSGLGLAAVRKVAEYIEILQPVRAFPEQEDADERARGFVQAARFVSLRINVDAAWGREVPEGVEIPLWRRGADPARYPRPSVLFGCSPVDRESGPTHVQVEEPDKLVFFSANPEAFGDVGGSDSWPPVRGVDYADEPLLVEQEFAGAGSLADLPSPREIPVGLERFSFRLTSAAPADVTPSGSSALAARPQVVTLMRANLRTEPTADAIEDRARKVDDALAATGPWTELAAKLPLPSAQLEAGKVWKKGTGPLQELEKEARRWQTASRAPDAVEAVEHAIAGAERVSRQVDAQAQGWADRLRRVSDSDLDLCAADAAERLISLGRERLHSEAEECLREATSEALEALDGATDDARDVVLVWRDRVVTRWREGTRRLRDLLGLPLVERTLRSLGDDAAGLVATTGRNVRAALVALADGLRTLERAVDGKAAAEIVAAVSAARTALRERAGAVVRALAELGARVGRVRLLKREVETIRDALHEAVRRALERVEDVATQIETVVVDTADTLRAALAPAIAAICAAADDVDAAARQLAGAAEVYAAHLARSLDIVDGPAAVVAHVIDGASEDLLRAPADLRARLLGWHDKPLDQEVPEGGITVREAIDAALSNQELQDAVGVLCSRLCDTALEASSQLGVVLTCSREFIARLLDVLDDLGGVARQLRQWAEGLRDAAVGWVDEVVGDAREQWRELYDRVIAGAKELDPELSIPPDLVREASPILALARTVVAAPEVAGVSIVPRSLALYPRAGLGSIASSPAVLAFDPRASTFVAQANRLYESLGGISLTVPFSSLGDGFELDTRGLALPTLPGGDPVAHLGRVFRGIGGPIGDALRRFVDAGSMIGALRNNVKVRHGHDVSRRTAWGEAWADHTTDTRQPLFERGALRLVLENPRLMARARVDIDARAGTTQVSSKGGIVANWALQVASKPIVTFRDTRLSFDDSGELEFDVDPKRIELPDILQWVLARVEAWLGEEAPGLTLVRDQTTGRPVGATFTLVVPIPDSHVGTSGVMNLTVGARFGLLVQDDDVVLRVGFSLARPSSPFTFSVFVLGGAGWADLQLDYGIKHGRLDWRGSVSVAASAALGFAFGPIRGAVAVYVGLTMELSDKASFPALSMRVVGWVTAGGWLTVLLEDETTATYAAGRIRGKKSVTFTVRVSRLVTLRFAATWQYEFAGFGGKAALEADGHEQAVTDWLAAYGIFDDPMEATCRPDRRSTSSSSRSSSSSGASRTGPGSSCSDSAWRSPMHRSTTRRASSTPCSPMCGRRCAGSCGPRAARRPWRWRATCSAPRTTRRCEPRSPPS